MSTRFLQASFVAALMVTAPSAFAQNTIIKENDNWCESDHGHSKDGDHYTYCEVREIALPLRSKLVVDATPNGSVSVRAWSENRILVRAKVMTGAKKSASAAAEAAKGVSVSTTGTIRANGLDHSQDDNEWSSVGFEIFAPASTDIDLDSQNGGIEIDGMSGRSRFHTQNGGVSLSAVSGDVSGETVNGGVSVELAGLTWAGSGLDVETTNGSVSMSVPSGYSAELETGTVNGRIKIDFPVMVEGEFDRRLKATLGDGGATIRAVTTNGSVKIKRG